jgi:ATP-dependent RNA helicase DeaD
MSFADLGAHPSLRRALDDKGYTQPTPVQEAVLAPGVETADLLVSAETGSGKTIAFGLALGRTLLGDGAAFTPTKRPLALVIAPTRELAMQVERELAWLYAPAHARSCTCVGGTEIRRELQALGGGPHIVVGTPGRLVDHLERGSLQLSDLKALVLDEADEMLDMGFREDLEFILSRAPAGRRTLLFSATIPKEIEQLAAKYQKDAKRIVATPPHQAHRDIEYRAHPIAMRDREHAVVNVLRASDASAAIVFCKTRESVGHLHANLTERGFGAVAISGELTQSERTRALKALRDGRARVLVATDVAARGLDLPDVSLVIHADLPLDAQVLQHRSGRTGRAGKKGVSVLLVPPSSRRTAERLLRTARLNPTWSPVPSAEQIRQLDESRIVRDVLALPTEVAEEDAAVARRLLAERTPEQIAALLSSLYRAKLPAPEDLALSEGLGTTPRPRPTAHARSGETSHPRPGSPRAASPRAPFAARPAPPSRPASGHPATPEQRPPPSRATGPRGKGAPPGSQTRWFSMNVGREQKADPKWLIPIICRRGGVTKADIGAIRILADETRIEITSQAAERFARSATQPDRKDPNIRFTASAAPGWSGKPAPRGSK